MDLFKHTNNPPLRLLVAFQDAFPGLAPEWMVQVPGRDMWLAAVPHQRGEFTIVVPDLDASTTFNLRSAKARRTVLNRPLPDWARYPAGVTQILAQGGLDSTGLDAIIVGEEPAGPRYHYALGMAVAALIHDLHAKPYTADSLMAVVEQVRREYVEAV
jgi:galactokinase